MKLILRIIEYDHVSDFVPSNVETEFVTYESKEKLVGLFKENIKNAFKKGKIRFDFLGRTLLLSSYTDSNGNILPDSIPIYTIDEFFKKFGTELVIKECEKPKYSKKIEKHIIDSREIHLPSDNLYVAVCWNTEEKEKQIEKDGTIYKATVIVRRGKPYISFVEILGNGQGGFYISDDNPIEGGLNLEYALEIVDELREACDYLKFLESNGEVTDEEIIN